MAQSKTKEVKLVNLPAFGMIPQMISPNSDVPLWQQIDKQYAHGGGWNDFDGFRVVSGDAEVPYVIEYPGDPAYSEIGRITIGNEVLVMFQYSWVLWTDGKETKIARID